MTSDLHATLAHLFNPGELTGALIYALIFGGLALLGSRAVRALVRRLAAHFPDPTGAVFLGQLAQVGVVLVTLILYAHLIPDLRAIGTALLAGASVLSLVLGFAAQQTLGNLISGVALVLYHPVRLGDALHVTTTMGIFKGTVKALTLGYTVLESAATEEVIVPNTVMASAVIVRIPAPAGDG
ncbi:MAG TPA: mechanosensitive ion channel family protein [Gemmatimonadales bacterium]|nr:mechanosensitive ion channel family protein [Gemmatimonadales bacterium]